MRMVLAITLGLEAVVAIERLARFAPMAAAYDAPVWIMMGLRALVTALQGAAAWMLWQKSLPAALFGRIAVVSSALLLTLEVGARLAPSSLPPGTRGPVIVGYWIYAAAAVFVLRRRAND